jgi:asparagine synthase (glutamine-hydrolysing)
MCGIVGYLNLNGTAIDPSDSYLPAMCHSIFHRGPDEEGRKIIGPVAMGMRRLSIIDLATGQQPITNEDETIWIVFNGEIYNFHDLQKKVLRLGHKLKTKSDTEVIVHLYEEYGVDCLQHLEGMFSFALWDARKGQLLIARDRMGEKPLHWGIFEGQLVFGSELKALLTHPKTRKQLNLLALQKYLALEYVPAPDSIFEGIHKLMPGHFMLVRNGNVEIKNYWTPKVETLKAISEEEAAAKLFELLDRSIQLRLISDVPLGVFLSGGVDSSSIAALAQARSSSAIKTFSVGFADPSFDESEYAQAVATHLGTDHEVIEFQPDMALETMQELWEILDEPIADASIVPTFFLSKMTRRKVTVALSGEGGDELFGGYPTYQAHRLAGVWNRVPSMLRKSVIEPTLRALPVNMNNLSFDYKVKRFIGSASESPVQRHLRWMGSISLNEQKKLINDTTRGARDSASTARQLAEAAQREEDFFDSTNSYFQLGTPKHSGDVVDRIMRLDLRTYLPDDLLVKSDRASMAASLEVRLPFLAFPLVEFALSLPSNLKVNGMTTKYLLKKAIAPYLPHRTIHRPKKGFGIPVAKWLNKDFRHLVDEMLGESFIQKQGLFEYEYINGLLSEHRQNQADRRKELWTLLMFQWWWRKYFA